jgi:hypothetical protein
VYSVGHEVELCHLAHASQLNESRLLGRVGLDRGVCEKIVVFGR